MLKLLEFLRREADFPKERILFMGGLSGVAGGSILAVINLAAAGIARQQPETQLFFITLILLVLAIYTQHYSLLQVTQAVEEILLKMRLRISHKLRHTELRFFEEMGAVAVHAPLSKDTNLISQAALSMTLLGRSAIVVTISLLYLGWISLSSLMVTVAFVGVYAFIYVLLIHPKLSEKLQDSLCKEAGFFKRLSTLLGGFKEIKLNQRKNDAVFEHYSRTASEINAIKRGINTEIVNSFTIGYSAFYLLLIVLVMIVPTFSADASGDIFRITATVIFIIAELDPWLTWIPEIARSNAAVEVFCQLEEQLDKAPHEKAAGRAFEPITSVQSLQLSGVVFHYTDHYQQTVFSMGPIDLTIKLGELLFIVGSNGSGKTMLLKLLSGLYYPDSGTITVDGKLLEKDRYPNYRELFSAVFADFYLFDRLYGLPNIEVKKVNQWLESMQLKTKTRYIDGQFTNLELSTGERKRLAFVSAILEDKPIYIFDELAADQDPQFRNYFYTAVLPDLKKQGKTVIAVTHDEKYFNVADRIFRMEQGKLIPASRRLARSRKTPR